MSKKSRAVQPMNSEEKPIGWPTALPDVLSDDAKVLYARPSGYLYRDPFDTASRHRHISPEEKKAYVASERVLAAAAELKKVGLGSYDKRYNALYVNPVHERYTVAEGRGSQLIRIYVIDRDAMRQSLLAVLVGADLQTHDERGGRAISTLSVKARHWNATDFEHDSSSTAQLTILNPSMPSFQDYGRMVFTGLLTEARLYDLGVDPLLVEDADTSIGVCEHCEDEHPFAPFLPPALEEFNKNPTLVEIECLPLRPYRVSAK